LKSLAHTVEDNELGSIREAVGAGSAPPAENFFENIAAGDRARELVSSDPLTPIG